MDDDALRLAVQSHKDDARAKGETVFSRRRVIAIAELAGEKPMPMVWRLEKLKLLPRGSYGWFRANGGITSEHVTEARCDRLVPEYTDEQFAAVQREAAEDDLLAAGTHYLDANGALQRKPSR